MTNPTTAPRADRCDDLETHGPHGDCPGRTDPYDDDRAATTAPRDAEEGAEKRTPDEWQRRKGLYILDPDGWRGRDSLPWHTPITEAEFDRRAQPSTQARWDWETNKPLPWSDPVPSPAPGEPGTERECSDCGGAGAHPDNGYECPTCHGSGGAPGEPGTGPTTAPAALDRCANSPHVDAPCTCPPPAPDEREAPGKWQRLFAAAALDETGTGGGEPTTCGHCGLPLALRDPWCPRCGWTTHPDGALVAPTAESLCPNTPPCQGCKDYAAHWSPAPSAVPALGEEQISDEAMTAAVSAYVLAEPEKETVLDVVALRAALVAVRPDLVRDAERRGAWGPLNPGDPLGPAYTQAQLATHVAAAEQRGAEKLIKRAEYFAGLGRPAEQRAAESVVAYLRACLAEDPR